MYAQKAIVHNAPTDRVIIDYSYPEASVKDCLLYYGLVDAVREVAYEKKNHHCRHSHYPCPGGNSHYLYHGADTGADIRTEEIDHGGRLDM